MKKIKYEVSRFGLSYRLYIITETYDELTKTGGMGIDVIMSGTKDACLKKKEELLNEKHKNR